MADPIGMGPNLASKRLILGQSLQKRLYQFSKVVREIRHLIYIASPSKNGLYLERDC
jgi:hypothetical protein